MLDDDVAGGPLVPQYFCPSTESQSQEHLECCSMLKAEHSKAMLLPSAEVRV